MPVNGRGESDNVVGVFSGDGSTNEAVLVIAHLDGLTAEQKKWTANRQGLDSLEGYAGTNDNASAVAAALTIADGLADQRARGTSLKRDVIFLFPSAEEEGLKGTEAFVKHTRALAGKKIVGVVNFEMVGTGDPNQVKVFGGNSEAEANQNPVYQRALNQPTDSESAQVVPGESHDGGEGWFTRSDHYVLADRVPSVMYLGEPVQYHTPGDNMSLVEPGTVYAVGRHALRLVTDLANDPNPSNAGQHLPYKNATNPFRGEVYPAE